MTSSDFRTAQPDSTIPPEPVVDEPASEGLVERAWNAAFRAHPLHQRVLIACGVILLLLTLHRPLFGFARHMLTIRPDMNDWDVFWGSAFSQEWQVISGETFRPVPRFLMGLSYSLFGLDVRPLAAFYLSVHVLSGVLAALVFRSSGLRGSLVVLPALAGVFSPATLATAAFLACQEPALGRFWTLATVLALLRPEGDRSRLWLVALLFAFGSHEIWVTILPLYLVCLVTRDGWKELRALPSTQKFRAFIGTFGGLLVLRALLYAQKERSSHQLALSALESNLRFFVDQAGRALREAIPPSPFAYIALVLVVCWCVFRTAPRPISQKSILKHLFSRSGWYVWPALGLGTISVFLGGAFLALTMGAPIRRDALRHALFGVAWAVASFGPFFFAASYVASYYFILSSFGVGLLLTAALRPLWNDQLGVGWKAVLLSAFALPFVSLQFNQVPPRSITAGDLVRPFAADAIHEAEYQPARVLFIEDAVKESLWHTSTFAESLSAARDENMMLGVTFPERIVYSAFLAPEHLPWLTVRKGERLLRVRDEEERFSVEVIEPPATDSGLPAAFRGPRPDAIPASIWDDAKTYWSARARFDEETVHAAVEKLESRGPAEKEGSRDLQLLREAITATSPVPPRRDSRIAAFHRAPPIRAADNEKSSQ